MLKLFCLTLWLVAVLFAESLAQPASPALAAPPSGPADAPMSAPCAVCSVREQAGPEPVAATSVYKDKTYYFCSEACKAEFQQDPEKWIKAASPATPPAAADSSQNQKPKTKNQKATAVPT